MSTMLTIIECDGATALTRRVMLELYETEGLQPFIALLDDTH